MTSFTEFQNNAHSSYVPIADRILFDDLTSWDYNNPNDTIFPEENPDKPYGGNGGNSGSGNQWNSGGYIDTSAGGGYIKEDGLEEYIEKIKDTDTKENTVKSKSPLLLVAALLIGIISLKK